jgi:transcriptional regulator with XRE-family HTH domain
MTTKTDKGESTKPDTGRVIGGREHLAEPVGAGIRKHREEAGMSLRALAREVGVSPSLISQIEHGKASPSVATLYAIVSELGISLDELFFDNPRGAAAVVERDSDPSKESSHQNPWRAPSEGPVLRAENRLSLTLASGVHWERLTASQDPGVEFLYCTYPVGGESADAHTLMTHEGSEYGIILEGHCGATVGDHNYELDPGDSIAFDSRTPHRIWNLSEQKPMLAVWTVVGRDGDPRVI